MVTVLALLGVLGVLFAAAVLATRDDALLADAPPDAADLALPDEPLQPSDVARLRFSLAARGYRMSEVDIALERLAAELADRDRRIALLEAAVRGNEQDAAAAPVVEAEPEDLPVVPEPAPPLPAPPTPAAEPAPAAEPEPAAVEPLPPPEPAPDVEPAPVDAEPAPVEPEPAPPQAAVPPAAAPPVPFPPAPGESDSAPAAEPTSAAQPAAPEAPAPGRWSSPASFPEFPVIAAPESIHDFPTAPEEDSPAAPWEPAPLPPADLASELVTEEILERAQHEDAAPEAPPETSAPDETHDRPQ